MQPIDYSAAIAEKINLPGLTEKGISIDVLRLDKIHPVVSGNKIFKLQYYLEEAIRSGKRMIATYGGAWSNHIVATAGACQLNGLACRGYIRGEEPREWSATLLSAKELGMELVFLSRESYALQKRKALQDDEKMYIIPEGGYGTQGAKGAAGILQLMGENRYSHICCAAGTGTMAAGIAAAMKSGQQLIVVSVLKNNHQLQDDVFQLTTKTEAETQFLHHYHFGGYAKYDRELTGFMNQFYTQTGIPSDFVYTGKLFYAVNDLLKQDYFPAGSRILLIHSGGLQGNASLGKGTLIF